MGLPERFRGGYVGLWGFRKVLGKGSGSETGAVRQLWHEVSAS